MDQFFMKKVDLSTVTTTQYLLFAIVVDRIIE